MFWTPHRISAPLYTGCSPAARMHCAHLVSPMSRSDYWGRCLDKCARHVLRCDDQRQPRKSAISEDDERPQSGAHTVDGTRARVCVPCTARSARGAASLATARVLSNVTRRPGARSAAPDHDEDVTHAAAGGRPAHQQGVDRHALVHTRLRARLPRGGGPLDESNAVCAGQCPLASSRKLDNYVWPMSLALSRFYLIHKGIVLYGAR
eukprot:4675806-Prymnesium_polylepis.1